MDQIDRSFSIGAMLPGSGTTTRVMGNLHERELREAEEFRLGPAELHEDRLTKRHRWLSALLQFNGVVDTPRRARPSGA